MVDLVAMQAEQIAWSEKNFGKQPADRPLLGLIEEIVEFDNAWNARDEAMLEASLAARAAREADPTLEVTPTAVDAKFEEAVIDAAGDIGIYMLDYCGKRGWKFNDIWNGRSFYDEQQRKFWYNLVPHAGKLAHHTLKSSQGIRGTAQQHDQEIIRTLNAVLAHLDLACRYLQKDYLTILEGVWSQVRKRDWAKNPTNAHAVAEASS